MQFKEIEAIVKGIPHTTPEKGRILYDTIRKRHPYRCLELGFGGHTPKKVSITAAADITVGYATPLRV